ncbi:hypothetical protein F4167_06525, partial [Candidatus Poribacteria bacterium]|nr:hypothetical protein [Candidatus Poribacteria bacterium]
MASNVFVSCLWISKKKPAGIIVFGNKTLIIQVCNLANASDVQITIYDTKGIVVRSLVLGHQAAGYYTDKNRAAYWDGRNSLGENVASGVYFYQLQTGE